MPEKSGFVFRWYLRKWGFSCFFTNFLQVQTLEGSAALRFRDLRATDQIGCAVGLAKVVGKRQINNWQAGVSIELAPSLAN